ncbi:MAG TPA: LLM class flavin-dependent oxidoreductase [Kineosporiaceae bacterium]|nr:LLM class flavin-dependent oxidoreductase [Kineosporiaceae bacterium]
MAASLSHLAAAPVAPAPVAQEYQMHRDRQFVTIPSGSPRPAASGREVRQVIWTALGFLAAHTSRARLLTLVTGVVYRDPGLLGKMATTLDVLSGGRSMLGIGAAWNEQEARGLGLSFPPTAERFERLEEALQIVLQMWSGSQDPYQGKYYRLERTLTVPG